MECPLSSRLCVPHLQCNIEEDTVWAERHVQLQAGK